MAVGIQTQDLSVRRYQAYHETTNALAHDYSGGSKFKPSFEKQKKIIQDPFLIQLVDCLLQRISNFLSPFSRKKDRKEIKLVFAKSGTFH